MLKITGLKKSYKKFQVLRGLNMSVDRGDVYGLIGTNGCGKTTTMNIICNVIPKDEGDVAFESDSIKIGYLPESPALYGYMNGFEYLDYIAACCDYDGDIKTRTAEVLSATGMIDGAKRLIRGYSRGMNQRIGIAAAMYAKPDLLILDEPTSALDPQGRAEVMEIITRLAAAGSTIILCTHILTDVERVANKVGILQGGVMVVEGPLQEIKRRYEGSVALNIELRNAIETTHPIFSMHILARSEIWRGGITLYARLGVTEDELFHTAIATLAEYKILPESVSFRRLPLEQIYIGVCSGMLAPAPPMAY